MARPVAPSVATLASALMSADREASLGRGNRMRHRSTEPGEWLVDWLDRKKKWKTGMKPCDNPGELYLKQWEREELDLHEGGTQDIYFFHF